MILYKRIWVLTEVELLSTAEITYGMLFFALIPFMMAMASLYAVWESGRLEIASPWEKVDLNQINKAKKETKKK
jgi:cellulose synthase (UDP-forming)